MRPLSSSWSGCLHLGLWLACAGEPAATAFLDATTTPDSAVPDVSGDAPVLADTPVPPDAGEPDTALPDASEPDSAQPDTSGACAPGEACAALLAADGTCPAACVLQPSALTCAGVVIEDLCLPEGVDSLTTTDPTVFTFDILTAEVLSPVPRSQVGDVRTLELRVTNTSDETWTLPIGSSWKPAWSVTAANFFDLAELSLTPGATFTLEASLVALRPDVFDLDGGWLMTFYLGPHEVRLHAGIAFPAVASGDLVTCGDHAYPPTWCGDELCTKSASYTSARCCDGVFFPGAMCCDDADCTGGICADGACVESVPRLGAANTLLRGPQRLLIVIADDPAFASDDPCADRSTELADALGLDVVESWLRGHALERTGEDLVDFDWTVLSGLDTAELLPAGADRWLVPYRDALGPWLAARAGCPALVDFDKVFIAAVGADLHGFGGVYLDDGLIGLGTATSPFLTAHELTHSFGATDLGQGLEGRFLYPRALMGTFPDPSATDQVTWAELGWGDVNRDGVIDVFEFAVEPDAIEAHDLQADLTPATTTEPPRVTLRWRVVGLEDGQWRRVHLSRFRYELPDLGIWADAADASETKTLTFDASGELWAAVLATGQLSVRLSATHRFTNAAGERVTRTLETVTTVPLTGP